MVRSLMALVLRRVLAWLVWSDEHAKDLEIVVLRHRGRKATESASGLTGSVASGWRRGPARGRVGAAVPSPGGMVGDAELRRHGLP